MFKSVRIQNFRQFKDLKLDGLAQINLITGKNNTGKTSLLEALNLLVAPHDPGIVPSLARLRGIDRISVDGSHAWGFIFHDGHANQPIFIEAEMTDGRASTLRIRAAKDLESTFVADVGPNGNAVQHAISTATLATSGLEYEYTVTSDEAPDPKVSRVVRVAGGWLIERSEIPNLDPWYFRAHRPADVGYSQGDDTPRPHEFEAEAQRFSQLVLKRRKAEVIEAARVVEPRVTDLEVVDLLPPTIVADVGLSSLVPMTYLGSGFEQMLKLIHAILLTARGTLLVDEIEHGFHYGTLAGVWETIIKAAIKHSVQVFVTTHSLEAIYAAVEGSKEHEGSLAFFRLQRQGDNIEVVKGEDFRLRAAARVGTELR